MVLTSGTRLEAITLKEFEIENLDEAVINFEPSPVQAVADTLIGNFVEPLITKDVQPVDRLKLAPSTPSHSSVKGEASALQQIGGASGLGEESGNASQLPTQTMGELWRAIEPCWKRLADKNTAGVTMHVSFTQLGNPAVTPMGAGAYDAGSQSNGPSSETLAINALAECGPYLMVYGKDNVQIAFPPGG